MEVWKRISISAALRTLIGSVAELEIPQALHAHFVDGAAFLTTASQEHLSHNGIELRAAALFNDLDSFFDRKRLFVATFVRKGVEHIGQCHGARFYGDAFPRQAVGIPASIPPLVMRAHDVAGHRKLVGPQKPVKRALHKHFSVHRVQLHFLELLGS